MLVWLLLAAVSVKHEPVDCVVKNQFSRIVARVEPSADVADVRLFFKSAESDPYFFVPMTLRGGEFVGRLPKAKLARVHYYIEAQGADGAVKRLPGMTAAVVNDKKSCPGGGRVAEPTYNEEVAVHATTASRDKPRGFDGVSTVAPVAARGRPNKADDEPSKPTRDNKPAAHEPEPTPAAVPAPEPAASVEAAPPPAAKSGPAAEYLIGAGDILRIVVYGQDTLTQSVIVQPDGTFTFPLIGRIKAADFSPDELQRKITILLAKDFIRNPQVTVNVQEYRSKTVFVVGQITKPGTYPLEGNTTIVSILAKAGPVTGNAVEVVIVRPLGEVAGPVLPTDVTEETPKATIMRVSLQDIETGLLEKNVVLQPNDTIFIPQAPSIFVSGEVRSPGAYAFRPGLTVRQAISLAGGFTERSSSKVRVVREANGKGKEVKIGLDDPVQRGDYIIVKEKLF